MSDENTLLDSKIRELKRDRLDFMITKYLKGDFEIDTSILPESDKRKLSFIKELLDEHIKFRNQLLVKGAKMLIEELEVKNSEK